MTLLLTFPRTITGNDRSFYLSQVPSEPFGFTSPAVATIAPFFTSNFTVLHWIISPAIQAGPLLHLQMEFSNVEIGCQLPCPCGGEFARQRRGGPKDKNVRVDNEVVHAEGVRWHPKQESDMICLKPVDCGLSTRKGHTWPLDNPWCRKRTQKNHRTPQNAEITQPDIRLQSLTVSRSGDLPSRDLMDNFTILLQKHSFGPPPHGHGNRPPIKARAN